VLSSCRRYRYTLWRIWNPALGYVMFVGLNPSTADARSDDPTLRRCIDFARTWGYGGLCLTNLFAFRATRPADMKAAIDPVGPANDRHLKMVAGGASIVVAAWGVHGSHLQRDQTVRTMLGRLSKLKLTKRGQPRHPLYLPNGLTPKPWRKV